MRLLYYAVIFVLLLVGTVLDITSVVLPNWIRFDSPTSSPLQYTSTYGLSKRCDRASFQLPPEWHLPGSDDDPDGDFPPDLVGPDPSAPARPGHSHSGSSSRSKKHWKDPTAGRYRVLTKHTGSMGVDGIGSSSYPVSSLGPSLAPRFSDTSNKSPEWRCRSFPLYDRDCGRRGNGEGHGFCVAWRGAGYAAQLSIAFMVVSLLGLGLVMLLGGREKRAEGWRLVAACAAIGVVLQITAMGIIAHLFQTDDRFYSGSRLDTSFTIHTISWVLSLLTTLALCVAGYGAERIELGYVQLAPGEGGDGYRRVD